jgi:trigger factor
MKKIKKFAAVVLSAALAMGVMTGCNGKTYQVSYDYDASEYIKLGEYKGVEVELGDYTVTEESLQNVIDQLTEQYCDYVAVDRPLQENDKALLNFDAYISGQKVGGFSGENYELVIGSNSFLVDGFEDQLIGLSTGDTRAITGLRIPETFTQEQSYAGRAVTFNVEVLGVYEPVAPDYDDGFVNALTEGEYTTTEEYNKELMRQLEANAETNRYNDKYDILLDKIISSTTLLQDLPEEYVTQKEAEISRNADFYSGLYDYTAEEYLNKQYGAADARDAAENIIMMEFVFQEIIRQENMTITAKDYSKNLAATAEKRGYTSTDRLVSDYTENGVVKLMLLDQAEEFIMNQAVEVAK